MKTRKSMTFWRWDRWIHQIRVFGTLFPGVWALFHGESCLWAWLLASDRLWVYLVPVLVPAPAGACKHDLFFLSLYIEKGTSAVFKEQRWEENPTDGIRLMTALAYSLWKWWAANNVSAGKIPDLVLCEWVCVCLWKALRRGCWNSLGSIHMYILNKKLRWGERKKIDWRQLEVNSIWHFKITQIFLSHSFDLSHNISATATSSLRVSTLERKPQQRPNCCSASPRRGC